MKGIKNIFGILSVIVAVLALNGCKSNSMMHCPDLASVKKIHAPLLTFRHNRQHNQPVKGAATEQAANRAAADSSALMASASQQMQIKLRMPDALQNQLQTDQELNDMNKLLAQYSNKSMALQRNNNGKLILKATSAKDLLALAKNASHPRGYYERRYGGDGGGDKAGAAVAAGVLGPISFVFAFLPFLSFLAIPISLAAIITGSIGLRSHRRGLASMGLTFGILGLIISILMSFFYLHFLFGIWLI